MNTVTKLQLNIYMRVMNRSSKAVSRLAYNGDLPDHVLIGWSTILSTVVQLSSVTRKGWKRERKGKNNIVTCRGD
jgi:hypothetical protein